MSVQAQIRQEVTEKIVQALETGTLPWRRPWRVSPNSGRSCNMASRNNYRGINSILLAIHGIKHGLNSKWWGTFKQIQDLDGTIKKRPDDVKPGEWGCRIVFFKPLNVVVQDEHGDDIKKQIPLLRSFVVFNADQCEGSSIDRFRIIDQPGDAAALPNFGPADELIAATKADIRFGGEQAYYRRPTPEGTGDYIQLPLRNRFEQQGCFYETVLHELAHWSECRVGFDHQQAGYAMTELVAELGATFLSGELGVPQGEGIENHAAYLKVWLEAMKGDSSFIFKASASASKTADYLLSFTNQTTETAIEVAA